MKKLIPIILVLTLFFSGCSNSTKKLKNNTSNKISKTDSQKNIMGYVSLETPYMTESPDSFYIMRNGFVMIIDKKTQKCIPLCNKLDCLHDKDDNYRKKCNAFIETTYDNIIYYDGKLYYSEDEEQKDSDGNIHTEYKIMRMNPDGSDREFVFSDSEIVIKWFKLHRGYIYISGEKPEEDLNDDYIPPEHLFRVSLEGGEVEELNIGIGKSRDDSVTDLKLIGNYIYATVSIADKNGESFKDKFVKLNLTNLKQTDLNKKLPKSVTGVFTVMNDKIVYDKYSDKGKLYECDLNGDNFREVLDCSKCAQGFDAYVPFTNDGERLFISAYNTDGSDDRALMICDSNYEKLRQIEPLPHNFTAAGNSEATVFVEENNDHKKEAETTIYYIDKTKLDGDFAKVIYEADILG